MNTRPSINVRKIVTCECCRVAYAARRYWRCKGPNGAGGWTFTRFCSRACVGSHNSTHVSKAVHARARLATLPVGTIRKKKKHNVLVPYVKVESGNTRNCWKPVHIVFVESIIGREIKKGEKVHAVDGNYENLDINNFIIKGDYYKIVSCSLCSTTLVRAYKEIQRAKTQEFLCPKCKHIGAKVRIASGHGRRRTATVEMRKKIRQLHKGGKYKGGMSTRKIAKTLGITHGVVVCELSGLYKKTDEKNKKVLAKYKPREKENVKPATETIRKAPPKGGQTRREG